MMVMKAMRVIKILKEKFIFKDRTNIFLKGQIFSNNNNGLMKCKYEACNYTDININVIEFHQTHCIFKAKSCVYRSKKCNFIGDKHDVNYELNGGRSNVIDLEMKANYLELSNVISVCDSRESFQVKSRYPFVKKMNSRRNSNKENIFRLPLH